MPPLDETRRDQVERETFDASPTSQASDSLRQEAYGNRQMERQAVNSVRSQNFDNPYDHMDRAMQLWRQGGFRAAEGEYYAAIRAADSIDQREVAAERNRVQEQLKAEQDPAKRRQLVEWEMTLHDMQRAPGTTRANLGLAYLRQGLQSEGVRLIMEASARDPEMQSDPNFIRRLRELDRGRMPGRQPQDYPQPGYPQPGYPQPGADRPAQPGYPQPGSGGARPQDYDPHAAHRGRAPADTRQPGTTGDASQPPRAGDQPARPPRVEVPSGTNRPDAQNFDNPLLHMAKANEDFLKNGKLSPEAKAEYEAAVKAADAVDRKWVKEQITALAAAFEKAYPKETQEKVAALERERDAIIAALPADKQKQLEDLGKKYEQAASKEEKEAIRKQMRDLVPDAAKKQDEIDALTAQPLAIREQLQALKDLNDSSVLVRFAFAEALRKSGDKEAAKKLLGEVLKLDPEAAKDDRFKASAQDVGLALDTPAPSGDRPPAATDKPATGADTGKGPLGKLEEANQVLEKEGMAKARPLFEQAVAMADQVDVKAVDDELVRIAKLGDDPATSEAEKKELAQTATILLMMKHAPFLTRYNFAVALNNNGEHDAAVAMMKKAAELDPEAAKEPTFQKAMEMAAKKEKITEESLKAAVGDTSGTSGGVTDNPYTHIQAAQEAEKAGNAKTAEDMWKKAIEAADKLPMDTYKAKLQEVDTALKAEKDPVKSQQLLETKKGLEEVVNLPAALRMETAVFYLKNAKPDEAKAMLEAAVQKNPALKESEQFKQLAGISQENSKDTITKTLDFLKTSGKEIISDLGAGTVGLAVLNLTPGGRVLKLGSGLLAGGATKHGLNMAMGVESSLGRDMVWGGVDTLAFASGAAARRSLLGKMEGRMTSEALLTSARNLGIKEAETLALLEGKSGVNGAKALIDVVAKNVEARKALASQELKTAIAEAPMWKKPLLWAQGHSPLLWRIPNASLEGFKKAELEYLTARGSRWNIANPLSGLGGLEGAGSLKNLEARLFWKRYGVDAAAVGATSFVYRGTHEGAKVGDVDPVTGKKYGVGDAVQNTVIGTAGDAVTGGFLIAGFRGMGGFFTKHSGVSAEVSPLTRPTLAEGASLYARATQPFRLANYGFQRYLVKPVGDMSGRAGSWLSAEGSIQSKALGVIPTGAAVFSPKLYEGYGMWEKQNEYEKILAEIQKPLTDKNQPPASQPQSDLPAEKPADKPAEQPGSQPADAPKSQPGSDAGLGEGLPE